MTVKLTGPARKKVEILSLTADSLAAENTFEQPDRVVPAADERDVTENRLEYTFPAHSVTVMGYR